MTTPRARRTAAGASALHEARERLTAERVAAAARIAALQRDIAVIMDAARVGATDDEHDPEGATIAFERAQAMALLEEPIPRSESAMMPSGGSTPAPTGGARAAARRSRQNGWRSVRRPLSASAAPPGVGDAAIARRRLTLKRQAQIALRGVTVALALQ